MVQGLIAKCLQIAKVQELGLVSRSAIFDTERKLARKLGRDIKKEMSDTQLQAMQEKRSKDIYTLRTRLKKAISMSPKVKTIAGLETQSIQKMRTYEKDLRNQVAKISQTIKDSHNLIIYEQEHATHDVAAILTFLTHFVEVIEINLSNAEISEYIPQEFQLKLTIYMQEAMKQLNEIEAAAAEALTSEFSIHQAAMNRAKAKVSNTSDLADLIRNRAQANKRLHGRLGHLKSVLKDIHTTLAGIAELAKSEPYGVFLPELSALSTHASVNLQLLHSSMNDAITGWPLTTEIQTTLRKEASELYSQLHDIELQLESKKDRHLIKFPFAAAILGHDTLYFPIKKAKKTMLQLAKITQKRILTKTEMNDCHRIITKYLHHEKDKLVEILLVLQTKTQKEKISPTQIAHKDKLFKRFIASIKTLEEKSFYFYKQIHARLKNTTEIISTSLRIQQLLAISLKEIQGHLEELYSRLKADHKSLADSESSTYKSNHHTNFASELKIKEDAFAEEIKILEVTVGKQIQHLIAEIPADQLTDQTHGAEEVKKLEREGSAVVKGLHEATAILGVHAA